jgi:hypothetical protein
MSKNRRLLRAQRHQSQPKTNNATSSSETIELSKDGLVKSLNHKGKKYVIKLTQE